MVTSSSLLWPAPTSGGLVSSTSSGSYNDTAAYPRVSGAPAWLPAPETSRLEDTYGRVREDFSPEGYNVASRNQQSRLLTTAMNAGNAAASDYANRSRQAGGSGMGAGLVKAQAATGARAAAGEMEMKRAEFEAGQREKASTQAAQIASTLGSLRDSYLKTLVSYATQEDQITLGHRNAADAERRTSLEAERLALETKKSRGGGYSIDSLGRVRGMYGDPLAGNPNFNNSTGYLAHGGW